MSSSTTILRVCFCLRGPTWAWPVPWDSRASASGSSTTPVTDCYAVCEPVQSIPKAVVQGDDIARTWKRAAASKGTPPRLKAVPARSNWRACLPKAFNEDGIVMAEAGTGVGKSFAYLVPALLWASRNKERVVVSTATINLQQQLFENDIPLCSERWELLSKPRW